MKVVVTIAALAFLAAGCATSFTGEAHVEGGPTGCRAKCKAWGMDLSGMVAVGEYSDACICKVRGKDSGGDESAAVGAAAVGVITEMRAAQQQQNGMMMMTVR